MHLEEIEKLEFFSKRTTIDIVVLEKDCLLGKSNCIVKDFLVFSDENMEKNHKVLEDYTDEDLED